MRAIYPEGHAPVESSPLLPLAPKQRLRVGLETAGIRAAPRCSCTRRPRVAATQPDSLQPQLAAMGAAAERDDDEAALAQRPGGDNNGSEGTRPSAVGLVLLEQAWVRRRGGRAT